MTRRIPLSSALFGLLLLALCVPAAAQPQLHASPPTVTQGATVAARAFTDRPGTYYVTIRSAASGVLRQSAPLTPDASGVVSALLGVDTLTPGTYQLVLSEGGPAAGSVDSVPLGVVAPLAASANPDPVRPGGALTVNVSGLRPGTARVLVGTTQVAGPIAVGSGAQALPVRVPADTPAGGTVPVEVRNFDGSQLVAIARTTVRVVAAPFSGPARITSVAGFPRTARVGTPFNLTGRLELRDGPPAGLLARVQVSFPDGRSLLIDDGNAIVGADGSFAIAGRFPTPWVGAPLHLPTTGSAGEAAVIFIEPELGNPREAGRGPFRVPLGTQDYTDDAAAEVRLNVRVRTVTDAPIAGAVVTLYGDPGLQVVSTRLEGGPVSRAPSGGGTALLQPAMVADVSTQIGSVLQQTAPLVYQKIAGECPNSLFRGETDAAGNLQIRIGQFAFLLAKTDLKNAEIANQSIDSAAENAPIQSQIRLSLSALPAGFTFADSALQAAGAETFLVYVHDTKSWCLQDANGDGCTTPIGVEPTLTYRPRPYTGDIELPLTPNIGGLPRQEIETPVDRYGPIVTFPGSEYAGIPGLPTSNTLPVRFTIDQSLFGIVGSARLLRLGSGAPQEIAQFPVDPSGACREDTDQTSYQYLLPGVGVLPHGEHRYRIEVVGTDTSRNGQYDFALQTVPPPEWWRNPQGEVASRSITWSAANTGVSLRKDPPPPAANGTPDPNYDMGTLENDNDSGETLRGGKSALGTETFTKEVDNDTRAVNEDAEPVDQSFTGIEFAEQYEEDGPATIFDTGWIPVFRYAWGVTPIAAATFGLDARFFVELLLRAEASINFETGQLKSLLLAEPSIGGALKAFLNVSALLGLVDLTASFTPAFGVKIPLALVDGELVNDPPYEPCFGIDLDLAYEVAVGICPVCVEASDEVNLVREREPNGCTIDLDGPDKRAFGPKDLAATGVTRLAPPSIAFDAIGQGALVRLNDAGAIEVRGWQAGAFGSASVLATPAVGASAVQHVFHAPGRAVMVYERSNLDSNAFRALDLRQAAASRALAFRTLSNGTWSAPQALTNFGLGGEGAVALAACPAGRPGCPTGGEVLAAWLRNPDGDAFAYRFEVWYAFFRNNAWTAPQRLADPGAGADMHPKAAYLGATPLVTFTRSQARSINAQHTRRLMYRVLPSGVAAEVAGAPPGVVWQSLAADTQNRAVLAFSVATDPLAGIGNQSALWAARGPCSGGTCTFTAVEQRDALGRRIRAESPSVVSTPDGGMRIAYRGLGYSPNPQGVRVAAGDTLGLITGSGELMAVQASFGNGLVLPQPLTADGQLNMNPVVAMTPLSNTLLVLADQGTGLGLDAAKVQQSVPFRVASVGLKATPLGGSLMQVAMPDAPDFTIDEIIPRSAALVPGGTITVDIALRNAGRPWVPDGRTPLALAAAWDGPPGAGTPAATREVFAIPASGQALLALVVNVPASFRADEPRTLQVAVNPRGTIDESDGGNNLLVATLGALPAPRGLQLTQRRGDRNIKLAWAAPTDARVRGHRIWRATPPAAPGGRANWYPVGSTFSNAFIDLTGDEGVRHWYRVTAYGAAGVESPPSRRVTAARLEARGDAIFKSTLESARGVRRVTPTTQ
jgi:hypothetical protein